MDMKRQLLGAVALLAMFSAFDANAQSSQNINVQATVNPTCVINGGGTAMNFNFGVIDTSVATDTTQSNTFTWRCSSGTSVAINLDAGSNQPDGSDPASARLLENGTVAGEFLEYLLCRDATCTQPWGDGTGGTSNISTTGSGMGNPTTETIFGVLDGTVAQGAVPGTYTETVVLTLVF